MKTVRVAMRMMLTALLVVSCSSESVEGNAEYLTADMIALEVEPGVKMFFLKNQNGTVSVTYDQRNPMHINIYSGTSNDYYKGALTIPATITVDGNSMTVEGITEAAFMNCTQLTRLTVPPTVKHIGRMAFYNCQQLLELNIPEGVAELPDYCFNGCKSLKQITMPSQMTKIGKDVFSKCTALESLTIPEGITELPDSCLAGCSGLKELSLPSTMQRMRRFSVSSCSKLKSIHIPEGMTELDDSVFFKCSGLLTVFLPETMTRLGIGAFAGCRSMVELTLPQSVTDIGAGCFCSVDDSGESNWKNFTLNVKADIPPVLKASISNAYARRRIVVPLGCREAYLAADYWNEFTQIMERNY